MTVQLRDGIYVQTCMMIGLVKVSPCVFLFFFMHNLKKQNKLSVCIGFLLVSNTNRLDAVPSRMGHIHV